MKRKQSKWPILGGLLVFVGVIIGMWGAIQTSVQMSEGATGGTAHSGKASVVTLTADTSYAIKDRPMSRVDACEVADPSGAAVRLTSVNPGSSTSSTYEIIYRFHTTVAGQYTVTCTAKSVDRTVMIEPAASFTDIAAAPLVWVGVVVVAGGIVALVVGRRQNAAYARERAANTQIRFTYPTPPGYPGASPYPAAPAYPGTPANPGAPAYGPVTPVYPPTVYPGGPPQGPAYPGPGYAPPYPPTGNPPA